MICENDEKLLLKANLYTDLIENFFPTWQQILVVSWPCLLVISSLQAFLHYEGCNRVLLLIFNDGIAWTNEPSRS